LSVSGTKVGLADVKSVLRHSPPLAEPTSKAVFVWPPSM